ncbi:hypothetical protein MP228_004323 [Amoeboaphelidium protococcarum]|nr:hypothetical protein MP228_004323 [Amoeboaphelidium protococcarum]
MALALDLYLAYGITASVFMVVTSVLYVVYFKRLNLMEEFDKRSGKLALVLIIGVVSINIQSSIFYGLEVSGIPYNCFISMVWNQFGYLMCIAGVCARAVRLFVQYRLSLTKSNFETSQEALIESTSGIRNVTWRDMVRINLVRTCNLHTLSKSDAAKAIALYNHYLQENKYIYGVSVYVFCSLVVFLIIYAIQNPDGQLDICLFKNIFIMYMPLYVMLAGCIFVFSPIMVYVLQGVRDIYSIRRSLSVQGILAGITFVLYFTVISTSLSSTVFFQYVRPLMFAAGGMIIMQVELIVFPLYTMMRGSQSRKSSTTNQKDFSQCLSDPKSYEQLKQLSIEAFTSENIKFWEDYLSLMQMCYFKMLDDVVSNLQPQQDDKLSRRSSTLGSAISQAFSKFIDKNKNSDAQVLEKLKKLRFDLSVVFNPVLIQHLSRRSKQKLSSNAASSPDRTVVDIDKPSLKDISSKNDSSSIMSDSSTSTMMNMDPLQLLAEIDYNVEVDAIIRKKFIALYEKYISKDSPFQINISSTVAEQVKQAIVKIKVGEVKSVDLKPMKGTTYTDPSVMNIAPFDKVKDEVLEMLNLNIYQKMLNQKLQRN